MKILKPILPITLVTACLAGLLAFITPSPTKADRFEPDGPETPGTPPIGNFLGSFRAVDIAGSYAFLLGDGLHVVDVSDPAAPFELATWAGFAAPPTALDVDNGLAFITVSSGLYVLDVSDPAGPVQIGYLPLPDALSRPAWDVHIAGDYAYIARRSFSGPHRSVGDILIVSVSVPETPTVVGAYDTSPNLVVVEGDRAFYSWTGVSYGGLAHSGFGILDVSDPISPTQIASLEVTTSSSGPYVWGIAVRDEYIYLALTGSQEVEPGLAVYDASDPANPSRTGFFTTTHTARLVALQGDHAYVTEMEYDGAEEVGLWALDISSPDNPRVENYSPGVEAQDFHVIQDMIYYVNESEGLFILPITGPQVAGRVTDQVGAPFDGVSITLSSTLTATTDVNGEYTLTDVPPGAYTVVPSLSGCSFWPPTRAVAVPPDALAQHFTILPAPVSITLYPGIASRLAVTDTQGLPTRIDFPAGAVSVTTAVTLTPTVVWVGAGQRSAGHAFDLTTVPQGVGFNVPVTVTVRYSDLDMRAVRDEAGLAMWWWEGDSWVDGMGTCDPPAAYTRDIDANVLGLGICQAGRFALVGPTHDHYLPAISRR